MIQAAKEETVETCSRCGICCRKGGPALHHAEMELLEILPLKDLVCLRPGEPAFDPRSGAVRPLTTELIKIRGKGDFWECLYYAGGCSIYAHRPLECRALSCRRTDSLFSVMETPTLTRAHFIGKDSALSACIAEHEARFPVDRCLSLLSGSAVTVSGELDGILRAELAFRSALAEAVAAADEDLWVYLGRPLWLVLRPMSPALGRYGNVRDF